MLLLPPGLAVSRLLTARCAGRLGAPAALAIRASAATSDKEAAVGESPEWTYDGVRGRLVARSWSGPDEPTHVVVIAHGYGEHIGRYERVADALVGNGAVVYAVDHVGHGKSEGERVRVEDFEDVVTDLHALDERARREHPDLPVVLLGHSMGGLIAARYSQRYGDTLAALVLSSPLVGRWDPAAQLLALEETPELPLDVTTLSRDPRVGEIYAADPLVWHGRSSARRSKRWKPDSKRSRRARTSAICP
jgi:alpha-beta hydrolase superfamily lysophospholipase